MKSLLNLFILFITVALVATVLFIVFYKKGGGDLLQSQGVISKEDVNWAGEEVSAVVNDMYVMYKFAGIDKSAEEVAGVTSVYDSATNTCEVQVESNYMEKDSPVFKILGALANCYGQSQLGFPTDNLDNDYNFINSWIRLYIDRCDRRLGPLGFPAQDGQCDVPGFEEVLGEPISS